MRNPDEFKKRLRLLMARDDINQQELCRQTGLCASTLRTLLNKPQRPRVDALETLAVHFRVKLEWLLGEGPLSEVLEGKDGKSTRS